jgi:uncharacterized protein YraI
MKKLYVGKNLRRIIKHMAAVSAITLALTAGTYTSDMPAYVYAAEEMNATGTVTNDTLNVRSGPGTDSDVIGQLHNGDVVDITGSEDGWYRIEFDEEVGYVAGNFIELSEGSKEASPDSEEVKEDGSGESEEEEDKEIPDTDYKMLLIIGGVILMLVIIIFATIKSIKKLSDDEYDDYDEYDEYEDEYDEDEYEDEYEDEEYDDEYEDDYYEDEEEYYEESVRPAPKPAAKARQTRPAYKPSPAPVMPEERPILPAEKAVRDGADPARYMSNNPDDYRIDIDPSYFEKTAALPTLDDEFLDDTDAPRPIGGDSDAPRPIGSAPAYDEPADVSKIDKEVRIEEALKKMEELKAEIESIKNEQT